MRAYDLIHASRAMDELGPGARETIERDLLRHSADFLIGIPTSLGNLEHGILRSLPLYGILIPEPRYDHLDLAAEFARQHQRMWEALKKLTFPNKDYAKLHDAEFPHGAWWDVRPTRSEPKLLGGMGHAILGRTPTPTKPNSTCISAARTATSTPTASTSSCSPRARNCSPRRTTGTLTCRRVNGTPWPPGTTRSSLTSRTRCRAWTRIETGER